MKMTNLGFERFAEDFVADVGTAFIKASEINDSNFNLSMGCIICGEGVKLTDNECLALSRGHNLESKVCNKCKEAIMYMRKQIKKE